MNIVVYKCFVLKINDNNLKLNDIRKHEKKVGINAKTKKLKIDVKIK